MQHRDRFIIKPAIVTIVMLVALACLAPNPVSGAPIIQEVFYWFLSEIGVTLAGLHG